MEYVNVRVKSIDMKGELLMSLYSNHHHLKKYKDLID